MAVLSFHIDLVLEFCFAQAGSLLVCATWHFTGFDRAGLHLCTWNRLRARICLYGYLDVSEGGI